MTVAIAIILVSSAAVSGCACVCASVEVEFETACREQGGQVQRSGSSAACIADKAVVATWTVDEDGGS